MSSRQNLLVLGSAGMGAVLVGGVVWLGDQVAASEWLVSLFAKVDGWFVPFLPLLVRIKKTDAMDEPRRRSILDAIRENPGITCEELCEMLEMSRSAVMHHLNVIDRAGNIVIEAFGRTRHHFVKSLRVDATQRRAQAALRHALARRALDVVHRNPAVMQQKVAQNLDIHPSQARRILDRLVVAGVLEVVRDGRFRRFTVAEGVDLADFSVGGPSEVRCSLPHAVIGLIDSSTWTSVHTDGVSS